MTDIGGVVKGILITATCLITLVLITWLLPPIIDTLSALTGFTDLDTTIWGIMLILYIVIGLVIPAGTIINSIQKPSQYEDSKLKTITLATILFLIGSFATYKMWYMFPTIISLANTTTNNIILTTIFYTSILLNWALIVIVTPTYMYIKAFNE